MAKHILYDASVVVNSVDLSDHVESVEFTTGLNAQPAAAMTEVQDYDMPGTIVVSPITVTFFADFAASKTYATLQTLITNRSTVTLNVKPTSAADSATNPNFTISVFVASFGFVTGKRGDRHMVQGVFNPAGALTIDVT